MSFFLSKSGTPAVVESSVAVTMSNNFIFDGDLRTIRRDPSWMRAPH